jgi:hypothetical protein
MLGRGIDAPSPDGVTKGRGWSPGRTTEKILTRHKHISTAALVVAMLALVASLGGGSYAAKLITGKDIKNGSITGKDIKKNSVKGKLVKDKSLTGKDLKDGSLGAADLAPGTLEPAMKALRVAATSGATEDAARAAAPEQVLFSKGPLTVYGKCFTDASGPETYAYVYIKTAANGAVFDSDNDSAEGGALAADYLNTDTLEIDRELWDTSASLNTVSYEASHSTDFGAFAADGTALSGLVAVGAKNGTVAGGNGPYGAGDACLFSGNIRSN